MSTNWTAVEAAVTAIDAHEAAMKLEPGTGRGVQLWHLIYSLLEWCDVNALDFDATVSEVRQDMKENP